MYQIINVKLSEDEKKKLKKHCIDKDVNLGEFVGELIKKELNNDENELQNN